MRRGFEAVQPAGGVPACSGSFGPAPGLPYVSPAFAHNQVNCARFFADMRRVLGVSQQQVAGQLVTRVETIDALERADISQLPPWPETARVVMAYAAAAGIDGRPVLSAIAEMMREWDAVHGQRAQTVELLPPPPHLPQPQPQHKMGRLPSRLPVDRFRRAGNAIAHGAARLPREALAQVRRRPDRAFYAVSFPLVLLVVAANTTLLATPLGFLTRPVASAAQGVKAYYQERFAPVREGFKWIEVDDPRDRRGDKLPVEPR